MSIASRRSPPILPQMMLELFPCPQHSRRQPGEWRVPVCVTYAAGHALVVGPALTWLGAALEERGHQLVPATDSPADLQLVLDTQLSAQAYVLLVGERGIELRGGDAAGLHYGVCTLLQLLAAASSGPLRLAALEIEDFPDFSERGVMLDVSRDKVPSMATLHFLIDRLASWKVNQLQLYLEHTFAYAGHECVWQGASPFSAQEIRELDAYCAERHVQLVPNQNSLGHMHRWLVHEPYRQLAECPEGFVHPWSSTREPYGLCATDPGSLKLLEDLYDQLLPNFRSRLFSVGLDETFDLGACRSRAACEERGAGHVYLEFLREVHARVGERGRRMQFWGDIIVKRPELIDELPRDAIALEWGYEADHPFAEHLAHFRRAGLEFYVCPGTSSWNSIAGRSENAILNIARAAAQGRAAGASGLLNTDWGDHGHLQPLSVSYLGLLLGAGCSWNVSSAERPQLLDVPALLDRHVFADAAGVLGRVAHDLGNSYREAGSLRPNASVLFWILIKPERVFAPAGVTRASLTHTLEYIERAAEALVVARPTCSDGALVLDELAWVRDLLQFACRLGLARALLPDPERMRDVPASQRRALAKQLRELIERHRGIWLARNRPGGLDDSARRLERLLATLS